MVAFIGLAPREKLSGTSIKGKPRLSKIGHARLRKALYMPVLVSIQCNPVMIDFYNRLKDKGKNGKVIVCAIMRKLVHVIFGVLKSGKNMTQTLSRYWLDKNGIYKQMFLKSCDSVTYDSKGTTIEFTGTFSEAERKASGRMMLCAHFYNYKDNTCHS